MQKLFNLCALSRSNPLCQGNYIFEADVEGTDNLTEYRQNRIYRLDAPVGNRYMDDSFPEISDDHAKYFESSFNDYIEIGAKKNNQTYILTFT